MCIEFQVTTDKIGSLVLMQIDQTVRFLYRDFTTAKILYSSTLFMLCLRNLPILSQKLALSALPYSSCNDISGHEDKITTLSTKKIARLN